MGKLPPFNLAINYANSQLEDHGDVDSSSTGSRAGSGPEEGDTMAISDDEDISELIAKESADPARDILMASGEHQVGCSGL